MKKIDANDLQSTISKYLEEYQDDVKDALNEALTEQGKEAVKELKSAGDFGGKAYRKGWKKKEEKSRLGKVVTVFNATEYYLTHLLEFGHVKQNGGRTRAFTHIEPVNEKAGEGVVEKLERKLK